MKLAADLHIHSCLSPCADDDMTPCNITEMARLKGLGIIAVTDHNSDGNAAAVAAAGAQRGLLVVPGVEVTTREEVHALCYFPELSSLHAFCQWLREGLPDIPNRPDFFGRQLLMDENDKFLGEETRYLPGACAHCLEAVELKALQMDGVMVPAHVNRQSNSLLSNLGIIPPDLQARTLEVTCPPPPDLDPARYRFLRSSDAHDLGAILEAEFFLEITDFSIKPIINNIY